MLDAQVGVVVVLERADEAGVEDGVEEQVERRGCADGDEGCLFGAGSDFGGGGGRGRARGHCGGWVRCALAGLGDTRVRRSGFDGYGRLKGG